MEMRNHTWDEVMYVLQTISKGLRKEEQTAVIKLGDDDPPAFTRPHLVSWWPAYLGFQQAKYPPGILKYTADQVSAQSVNQGEAVRWGSGGAGSQAASLNRLVSCTGLRRQSSLQHRKNVRHFDSVFIYMKNGLKSHF